MVLMRVEQRTRLIGSCAAYVHMKPLPSWTSKETLRRASGTQKGNEGLDPVH